MSEYGQKAKELFLEGYNCAQAVVLAFGDVIQKNENIDTKTLLKMASPFGGGMGRLREVCGSISGIFMVLGVLEGYHAPEDRQGKIDLYRDVQQLAGEFQRKNGSILCRELLANHLRTCVAQDIRAGHDETIDELLGILQKMMK